MRSRHPTVIIVASDDLRVRRSLAIRFCWLHPDQCFGGAEFRRSMLHIDPQKCPEERSEDIVKRLPSSKKDSYADEF